MAANTHIVQRINASELVGIFGFACMFAWAILSFLWLFPHTTYGINAVEGRVLQTFIYLGLPAGYLIQHLAVRVTKRKHVNNATLVAATVVGFGEPTMCMLYSYGIDTPLPIVGLVNFLTGIATSFFIISWLDACIQARWENVGRFTASSLLMGSLIAACASIASQPAASIIAMVCIVSSTLLAYFVYFSFATEHVAEDSTTTSNGKTPKDLWGNPLEIEPSFFIFGISFGFAFQQLVAEGTLPLLIGLLCGIAGSLLITVLAAKQIRINITTVQRVITCIVVVYCTAMQFATLPLKVALSGLVFAAWAALVCANFAIIIDKCELEGSAFCEQAPVRLIVRATGFACGWILAAALATYAGDASSTQHIAGIIIALAAVGIAMAFYPQKQDHISYEGERPDLQRVVFVREDNAMTKRGLFERRCEAVSELYGLSPRESEVLRYLARGRNSAYIENELGISQNTVKTHIRKVYNKLDIHSQQNLMDFIESYPIED